MRRIGGAATVPPPRRRTVETRLPPQAHTPPHGRSLRPPPTPPRVATRRDTSGSGRGGKNRAPRAVWADRSGRRLRGPGWGRFRDTRRKRPPTTRKTRRATGGHTATNPNPRPPPPPTAGG